MSERVKFRPFTQDSDRSVKLENPPLALVLAQIRWPEYGRFVRNFESTALDFGERLDGFPLFTESKETTFQISPEGVTQTEGDTVYQWRSDDDVWGVHLSKRFVTLFCTRHEGYSFKEFSSRLEALTKLIHGTLGVRTYERIGMRYVNRITDVMLLEKLEEVFSPAVLGYYQLNNFDKNASFVSGFSQAMYQADEVALSVRSGFLAPGDVPDPSIAPSALQSWVLDLDASTEQRMSYSPSQTVEAVGKLSDAAFDFFKLVLIEGKEELLEGAS